MKWGDVYIGPPDNEARFLINQSLEKADYHIEAGRDGSVDCCEINVALLKHYLRRGYVLPECRDRAERTIEAILSA